ncbi:hypothetical protein CSQ85_01675 [Bifidobacterium rousetti]|uniref:hypothetical protein n=1 Tax=Bifidobacterium rousetti TaxID=2045439 RepID=UPI00123BE1C1|nr:hypothetical protein [Bifidobacterium rousetti]KAA8820515.1 hypothetical protein CSQ85_01675 [Bifidobacterium rousetti]
MTETLPVWAVILTSILGTGGVGGTIIVQFIKHLESNRKADPQLVEILDKQQIMEAGMKALLFDKIARLHAETVERGLPVSTEIKTRTEAAYQAYAALGGNGVGKHYRDELIEAHANIERP